MKVGLVSFFMVTTEGNKQYANLVTVTSPQNALPAPGDEDTQAQREFNVQFYQKPMEETNTGFWLTNNTWGSLAAHIVAWGALVSLSSFAFGRPGPTITFFVAGWDTATKVVLPLAASSASSAVEATIPYVAPVFTGLLAATKDLTFNKAALIYVAGQSWWYGSNSTLTTIDKIADSAVKISRSAGQAGIGLAAVVLSGVVLFVLVDNVSTRKKRKLF